MNSGNFALTIYEEHKGEARCPHIRADSTSPYCGKNLKGDEISEQRRASCGHMSLQFWCLTENYGNCIWYKGIENFTDGLLEKNAPERI